MVQGLVGRVELAGGRRNLVKEVRAPHPRAERGRCAQGGVALGGAGFPALGRDANAGARTAGGGMRSDQHGPGGGYGGHPGAYMLPPQPLPYAIPLPQQRQPAASAGVCRRLPASAPPPTFRRPSAGPLVCPPATICPVGD